MSCCTIKPKKIVPKPKSFKVGYNIVSAKTNIKDFAIFEKTVKKIFKSKQISAGKIIQGKDSVTVDKKISENVGIKIQPNGYEIFTTTNINSIDKSVINKFSAYYKIYKSKKVLEVNGYGVKEIESEGKILLIADKKLNDESEQIIEVSTEIESEGQTEELDVNNEVEIHADNFSASEECREIADQICNELEGEIIRIPPDSGHSHHHHYHFNKKDEKKIFVPASDRSKSKH
jgi:hypothetical protein